MSDKMLMEDWRKFLVEAEEESECIKPDKPQQMMSTSREEIRTNLKAWQQYRKCLAREEHAKELSTDTEAVEISAKEDAAWLNLQQKDKSQWSVGDLLIMIKYTRQEEKKMRDAAISKKKGERWHGPLDKAPTGILTGKTRWGRLAGVLFPPLGILQMVGEEIVDLRDIAQMFKHLSPELKAIKEEFPFIDLFDIDDRWSTILNKSFLARIDEAYQGMLEQIPPDTMLYDVEDINDFIKNFSGVCPDETNNIEESKFHDNWRNFLLTEIRFQPQTLSELGTTIDGVIENFYNGKTDFESAITELKLYLASGAEKNQMDVDSLIDHLIDRKFSFELDGFLYDPKFREMLK